MRITCFHCFWSNSVSFYRIQIIFNVLWEPLKNAKQWWYLFHTYMARFAVAGVFTYACTIFLSLHAWTSWFPAFWPIWYFIVFLHVVQATTVCEGERNITFWNLFPIQSITSVMANFFNFKLSEVFSASVCNMNCKQCTYPYPYMYKVQIFIRV